MVTGMVTSCVGTAFITPTEGKIEVTVRRGRRRKQILGYLGGKEKILRFQRGSTRSHSVENSL